MRPGGVKPGVRLYSLISTPLFNDDNDIIQIFQSGLGSCLWELKSKLRSKLNIYWIVGSSM